MEPRVVTIPFDQCICAGAKRPRSNCWALTHDLTPTPKPAK